MNHWNEIKTAYQVGRSGTVSAAAKALGMNRATVIKHIDVLEAYLGQKVFLRHQRGYTLTEAGAELINATKAFDDHLAQTVGKIKRRNVDVVGEIIITSVERCFGLVADTLRIFLRDYPGIRIKFTSSQELFKLEYGEAHIALRVGAKPSEPDYVVQHLCDIRMGLYAAEIYRQRQGLPESEKEFGEHDFVFADFDVDAGFFLWAKKHFPVARLVFVSNVTGIIEEAVKKGLGIGFLMRYNAKTRDDLIEVMPPKRDWIIPFWAVTHVDQHRSEKIQACLQNLRDWAAGFDEFQ